MNELISALLNRNDADSYHMLSRAYYATEQWDAAIQQCGARGQSAQRKIPIITCGWAELMARRRLTLETR